MRSIPRLLLLALGCVALTLPAAAAPAGEHPDTLYLADTQVLDSSSPDRRRPPTMLLSVSMDGVSYENSLGLRAAKPGPVHATFGIGRRYSRFRAQIGLPDNIPTKGRIRYEVDGDGKQIYRSPILRAGDRSIAVDLDVSEVQRLTLRGQALDATEAYLIVWGDARVLPKSDSPPPPAFGGHPARDMHPAAGEPALAIAGAVVEQIATALASGLQEAGAAKGPVLLAEFAGVGVGRATTRAFAEELSTALIRRGVKLIERGQFEAELRRRQPDPDAPLSPAVIKALGQQTGAGVFIVGSLTRQAGGALTGETLIVNARALSAETGVALFAHRAQARLGGASGN